MPKLSAFVTTFNNADTLASCLKSVEWADEIVVLDSFSTDETMAIAESFGAKTFQHKFMGYGPQKQMALEHTTHNWVLLLDADEELSPELQQEIREVLQTEPDVAGFELPRLEQLFWRMCSPNARLNFFLRLFDKSKGHVSDMPIHAAPKVKGRTRKLKNVFYHYGERTIHIKVDKINHYSTGLVVDKKRKRKKPLPWLKLLFYPPLVFLRIYIFKRNFLNGWAGFINSVTMAFYAFLKYAKLYENEQFEKHGSSLLPPGSPDHAQYGTDREEKKD